MRIKVLKFGGTSVADPEKIHHAAERAVADRRRGWSVVVVVSAPGEMTDELLALGRRVSAAPPPRETDQLDPRNVVDRVHPIVLTGGSPLGFASVDGVEQPLLAAGKGPIAV